MVDLPQRTSSIKRAKEKISGFLDRTASTASNSFSRTASFASNSLRRPRSKTTSTLPSKDAVPERSALRGSRVTEISLQGRVSFYDSLPCLDFGPPLRSLVPFSTEWVERKNSMRTPTKAQDNLVTDDDFQAIGYSKEQPDESPGDPQPAARQDSYFEATSLRRSMAVRHPRTGSGSTPALVERRRTCLDFTSAVMEERARTQSRIRSSSLLANRPAGDRPSRPVVQRPPNLQTSQDTKPQPSSSTQKQITNTECSENISHTYQAHVNRSLLSTQGSDHRRSAFLHASLVQVQEALLQAEAQSSNTEPPSTGNEEADRARARIQALQRLSRTEDSETEDDSDDKAFFFNMPYDSAQPSAESIQSIRPTQRMTGVKVRDFAYANHDEDFLSEAALVSSPPRVPPRHPGGN
jgi:hypothetical protein